MVITSFLTFVNTRTIMLNYKTHSCFTLTLLYGCELFSGCDSVSNRRLNVMFNNISRYVYGIKKYDYISNYNTKLYGVSLENLFKIKTLILLQKIVYLKYPIYLFDRLTFARLNRGNMLITQRHRTLVSHW